MIKHLNLNRDGCQYFKKIYNDKSINDLDKKIDEFLINEKIFHKIYHDPFITNKKYVMFFSSQLGSKLGSSPKKSMIVINGYKSNIFMKASFAILYPEYLFQEELDEIVKIELIYLLLKKITNKKWYLDNMHISIQIGCNDNMEYERKSNNKEIKMYIPLSDVNTLKDGPFLYIRYSHIYKKLPKYFPLVISPMKRGDIILLYNNGLQKIGPQSEANIRKILILNFKIL